MKKKHRALTKFFQSFLFNNLFLISLQMLTALTKRGQTVLSSCYLACSSEQRFRWRFRRVFEMRGQLFDISVSIFLNLFDGLGQKILKILLRHLLTKTCRAFMSWAAIFQVPQRSTDFIHELNILIFVRQDMNGDFNTVLS